MICFRFLDDGREVYQFADQPIDDVAWEVERTSDIEKEYHAVFVRIIPYLMVVCVIKYERFSLLPMDNLVSNLHTAFRVVLGNFESEMVANGTLVNTLVARNVFARCKDREERRLNPGYLLQQFGSVRTTVTVGIGAIAIREEYVGLPLIVLVVRQSFLFRGNVLNIGKMVDIAHNLVQLLSNHLPVAFELF